MNSKAGEVAETIMCLLYKHDSLSSVHRADVKKLGIVLYACNPSTGDMEIGSLEVAGQPA